MAGAPLDPQSPARRLLRVLSLPLPLPLPRPLPLPSRTPTPGPDSAATDFFASCIELEFLEPPPSPSGPQQQRDSDFLHGDQQQSQQIRRRQQITTATIQEDITRLPWPVQAIGAASSTSRHRRSFSSCFSDASSLSALSFEAEPRATAPRPKAPRTASREAESEAIWREHWI